jgi:hypothetical protein
MLTSTLFRNVECVYNEFRLSGGCVVANKRLLRPLHKLCWTHSTSVSQHDSLPTCQLHLRLQTGCVSEGYCLVPGISPACRVMPVKESELAIVILAMY